MEAVSGVSWLEEVGLSRREVAHLNPCVPGEFTMAGALYVNTGSPRVVYHGTEEGTLPLVAGKWYLLPTATIEEHPELGWETAPVARARRLVR